MGYLVFLSYNREEGGALLDDFVADLKKHLTTNTTHTVNSLVFVDATDIKPGEQWPEALVKALSECEVFVPLYTPRYFAKEACGQEWTAFAQRRSEYLKNNPDSQSPARCVPVMWAIPRNVKLPEVVDKTQYAGLGDDYKNFGMASLMQNDGYKAARTGAIQALGQYIIEAAKLTAIPPLGAGVQFKNMASAWAPPPQEKAPVGPSAPAQGPDQVEVVFIVGEGSELKVGGRTAVDSYGDLPRRWRPYWPPLNTEIWKVVQSVATKEGFAVDWAPLDKDLITRLKDAESRNCLVAIVAEPWTLALPKYRDMVSGLNEYNAVNTVMLIAWNPGDAETLGRQNALRDAVDKLFRKTKLTRHPKLFADTVSSLEELERGLVEGLTVAKGHVLSLHTPVRRAGSEAGSLPTL